MKILLDVNAVFHKVEFHFLHVYIKIKPRIFMVSTFLLRHNLNHFKSLYITFNKAYIYGLWAATSCILAPQLLGWEPLSPFSTHNAPKVFARLNNAPKVFARLNMICCSLAYEQILVPLLIFGFYLDVTAGGKMCYDF